MSLWSAPMPRLAALLLALLPLLPAVAASTSCGGDENPVTEILVAIDSDIENLNRIQLKVDFFSDERIATKMIRGDMSDLPQTVGVLHQGGPLGPIGIEATGFIGDDEVAVRRAANVSFVRNETMVLRIDLTANCIPIHENCDNGRTCIDGLCVPADLSGSELTRWSDDPGRSVVAAPDIVARTDGATPGSTGSTDTPPTPPGSAAGSTAPPPQDAGTAQEAGTAVPPAVDSGTTDAGNPCADPSRTLITPDCHVDGADCSGSACILDCSEGWDDCDGDPTSGCETDILSDVNNCGECGRECPSDAANVEDCLCLQGEPALLCTTATTFPIPIFADCDDDPTNGCEADLTGDENCGMCGRQCVCQALSCAAMSN